MKIACYGFVEKKAGSVASANFLIIEELLKRAHKIDFFGSKNFVFPKELLAYPNFSYNNISVETVEKINATILRLPGLTGNIVYRLFFEGPTYFLYYRRLKNMISRKHRESRYDLLLFLGLQAPININGLSTISWLQGPPQTEWEAIQKNKAMIIQTCGCLLYYQLKIFYAHRIWVAKRVLPKNDIIICGSRWSADKLNEFGINAHKIKSLPYPIDLTLFKPHQNSESKRDTKVFLWLGRIDPRKRLDLLIAALDIISRERKDIQLKITGDFSYAKKYKQLIRASKFSDKIEYNKYVDRDKVPALMNSADILIQPSEYENFGSSVAEALACGKPVILGPTNGTKDYVGTAAFIFDSYDPGAVKSTILEAIETIEKDKENIVYKARKIAEENFAISKVVDKLEIIFKAVIESRCEEGKKHKKI